MPRTVLLRGILSAILALWFYALIMASDPDGQREWLRQIEEAGPGALLEPWVLPFLKECTGLE